jgi:2,3-bisphosphoglycerate-dependent phosphoglycerate mutase
VAEHVSPSRTLVLVRHGESTYNRENRFAGWTDVPLSERGREQAYEIADALRREAHAIGGDSAERREEASRTSPPAFSRIFTSVLRRALESAQIIRQSLGLADRPIVAGWRLNERHYGNLEGRDKVETATEYGVEIVQRWRRALDARPPPVPYCDPRHPIHDPRYRDLSAESMCAGGPSVAASVSRPPSTESLSDAIARLLPFWESHIVPAIVAGPPVLICAHGSTVRAILTILENLTREEVLSLNIPNGFPILCTLATAGSGGGDGLRLIERRYLGDSEAARREARRVARQAVPPEQDSALGK